ncbi:MAG: TetR/AcrR family transcriptional regulator [Chloroflexaceae bacterium]|jgi:AcrR family transcriptional regulator|nr:TetR/AcrR family transcriptional regulator [Chloroflexaceae bacterium]
MTLRRERKDMRRNLERVLQAAHELFAERGSEVTMEEIARRAGVGVGTLYRRFASKEALFAAVSQAVCDDTRHCLATAADDACDPLSKLHAIVLLQCQRNQRQAASGPDLEQQGLYDTLHGLLAAVIAEGQAVGRMRPGDPEVLAALCLELLTPAAYRRVQRLIPGDASEIIAGHVLGFMQQ